MVDEFNETDQNAVANISNDDDNVDSTTRDSLLTNYFGMY